MVDRPGPSKYYDSGHCTKHGRLDCIVCYGDTMPEKDPECIHQWRAEKGGMRCQHCQWFVDDDGPLPQKGLGIGLFQFKEKQNAR